MQLTPGYSKYHRFSNNVPTNHKHNPIITHPTTTVSDDEGGKEDDQEDNWGRVGPDQDSARVEIATEEPTKPIKPTAADYDLNGANGEKITEVNIIEEDVQGTNLAVELLRIHHCMGHALFAKLQELAKQRSLPARLRNCPIPMCTACAYRKASRKAWREKPVKGAASNQKDLRPGDMVLVNQMVSPIPGLVAQITGHLPQRGTIMQGYMSTK
jgi:hypothetical protein